MTHGERRAYRLGCRCDFCRDAETRYKRHLRLRKAKGLPILGQYISASEAWARIRVLRQEHFTNHQISGYHNRHLPILTPDARVRLVTLLKLRRLCRLYLIDDDDLPNHVDS